jgi:DNA polymerase-3 subunit beta
MRFRVERDVLAEAVAWVARALPSRPVIPVLSGLLLRADDEGLTLSCFDYEVSARIQVSAEVAEPGTALVPGRLLAEITRSLPGLPAEFADDPEGVSLTCGSAAFTLVTLPIEDYPELPELPQLAGTVDGGVLAGAIGQVAPAASRDDTLPMLTGVNIEINGAAMTLAATDRYRLAMRELEWSPAQPDISAAVVVPARTLADAARTMSAGLPVTIRLSGGPGPDAAGTVARAADAMIGFETAGRRLTTRLIASEFIKYRSRFPAEFGSRADMPAGKFTEAVKRVALVAERGTPVRLTFGSGAVTIEAGTQGQARARETVPADFEGDEPGIAFSPHYLLDGLAAAAAAITGATASVPKDAASQESAGAESAVPSGLVPDGDGRIRLEFNTRAKPAVITGAPPRSAGRAEAGDASDEPTVADFRYLVVPLRVL